VAGTGGGLTSDPHAYWKQYGGPGFDVVKRAEETIQRFRMLESGDSVVVAVSGGPDSTCLLDVLARLGERLSLALEVAHVDHRLDPNSEHIAAEVSGRAAKEGFEVHLARAPDLAGANLHARARDFRYEFFDIVADKEDARCIATGHTLDDRVETTLARLIHGAGTSGLAGLPPSDGRRIRPLIELRRSETRAYCEEVGLSFLDDPGNEDPRFDRTLIRKEIMTAIESHWGEGAVRAMATSAERLLEDARALEGLTEAMYGELVSESDTYSRIEREKLIALPRSFRRRVLERVVGQVRDRSGGIDAVLDALDDVDRIDQPARFSVASGIEIELRGTDVVVSRLTPPTKEDPRPHA
jgi:tRNA(Ile)-lysidine synthase